MRLLLPLGFLPRTRPSCISTAFRFDLSPPYHLSTWSLPYLRRKSSKVCSSFSGTNLPVPSNSISETSTSTRGVLTRSEEHTSELQSLAYLVCRLLLEKKN